MTLISTHPRNSHGRSDSGHVFKRHPVLLFASLLIFLSALISLVFRDSLPVLLKIWITSPEYNYGPIVPFLATIMIWRDLNVRPVPERGGWWGVLIAAIGLMAGILAFRTQMDFIGHLGLLLAICGTIISVIGEAAALRAWPGIMFLFFALPMAQVVQFDLTWALQLVASRGSVGLIQLFGIPVFREGNVIDFGQFQLQVAEACSGLRYLFPLACFSFLCAYFFRASRLVRFVVFLSALPITVLMNIVRIVMTGFFVNAFGIGAAQGFFHEFEGWAVFVVSTAVLFLGMKLLCLVDRRGTALMPRFDLTFPRLHTSEMVLRFRAPVYTIAALCVISLGIEMVFSAIPTPPLSRSEFFTFPSTIDNRQAIDAPVEQEALTKLDLTDYISRNYLAPPSEPGNKPINLFIAYYGSQHSKSAIHSPQVCIPGGGWEIEQIGDMPYPSSNSNHLAPKLIKRLIIRQGQDRQLVYYWFEIGGKPTINEYSSKLQLFSDAILANRTDGALIRFVIPIGAGGSAVAEADTRLMKFAESVTNQLPGYLP